MFANGFANCRVFEIIYRVEQKSIPVKSDYTSLGKRIINYSKVAVSQPLKS